MVREEFALTAFDGEGARRFGGRWNSSGRAAVYASAATSLGLLEQLVHADAGLLGFYVTIPVTFGEGLLEEIDPGSFPANWRTSPPPPELQQIGNEWFDGMRSCVLEVPSVIVPHESNFILNPKHPDFASIHIGDPIALEIDPRLI